jgi:hypothetical protein
MLNPFAPDLFDAGFWTQFMRERRDLRRLIGSTGYPAGYVIDRAEAFLRGHEAERQSQVHPGTTTSH